MVARVRFASADAFDRHCRKYATPTTFVLATAGMLPSNRDIELRVLNADDTSLFEARVNVLEKIPNGYRLALLEVPDPFRNRLAAALSSGPAAPVKAPQGLVPGSVAAMPWDAPAPPPVRASPSAVPPAPAPVPVQPVPVFMPAAPAPAPPVPMQPVPAAPVPVFMPKAPAPTEAPVSAAAPAPVPAAPQPPQPAGRGGRSPIVLSGLAVAGVAAVAAMFFFVSVDVPARAVAESTVTPVPAPTVSIAPPPPPAVVVATPDISVEVAALTEKGMAALNAGDAPGALEFFRQALALDPEHARAHLGVGTAAMLRGDNEAAKSSLVKFVALAPDDPLAAQTRTLLEAL